LAVISLVWRPYVCILGRCDN